MNDTQRVSTEDKVPTKSVSAPKVLYKSEILFNVVKEISSKKECYIVDIADHFKKNKIVGFEAQTFFGEEYCFSFYQLLQGLVEVKAVSYTRDEKTGAFMFKCEMEVFEADKYIKLETEAQDRFINIRMLRSK